MILKPYLRERAIISNGKFYDILAWIEENDIELDSMHKTAAGERKKALQKAKKLKAEALEIKL